MSQQAEGSGSTNNAGVATACSSGHNTGSASTICPAMRSAVVAELAVQQAKKLKRCSTAELEWECMKSQATVQSMMPRQTRTDESDAEESDKSDGPPGLVDPWSDSDVQKIDELLRAKAKEIRERHVDLEMMSPECRETCEQVRKCFSALSMTRSHIHVAPPCSTFSRADAIMKKYLAEVGFKESDSESKSDSPPGLEEQSDADPESDSEVQNVD